MKMTVSQAMVECLKAENVKVVFGYPGAAICPFYDALLDAENDIRQVLVRQEANGGHAANGYARISGKPAVCIATSGPGATNLITAIATAYADSIPIVCITGQVNTDQIGSDVFQEADITGSAEPFVKHSYLLKDPEDTARVFKEAFYIAGTGRPGPVLIDIPMDVQKAVVDFEYPEKCEIRSYKPTTKGNYVQVRRVMAALEEAEKPLICIGGGVFAAHAENEIRELADLMQIPVITTMMGISVFPDDDQLFCGMIGTHGVKMANAAVNECDVLFLVGARVGDRAVKTPLALEKTTKIIHIDIDPAEIGKNMTPTVPLVGDVKNILIKLLAENPVADSTEWIEEVTERSEKEKHKISEKRPAGTVGPRNFMLELGKQLNDDSYVVADVGQNQIWAGKYIPVKNGRFLTSGGLGTMGYSLPAGIGVKFADPGRQTVVVCGDGSFQMMLNELSTVSGNGLDLKVVLFNNRRLGMVNEIQKKAYSEGPFAVYMPETPDFCKLADAYGIAHRFVDNEDDMSAAIAEMLSYDGPFLLECRIDPDESTMIQ